MATIIVFPGGHAPHLTAATLELQGFRVCPHTGRAYRRRPVVTEQQRSARLYLDDAAAYLRGPSEPERRPTLAELARHSRALYSRHRSDRHDPPPAA